MPQLETLRQYPYCSVQSCHVTARGSIRIIYRVRGSTRYLDYYDGRVCNSIINNTTSHLSLCSNLRRSSCLLITASPLLFKMFQKTHHHRKPVEITAPNPSVGHFQYPPPAHLLVQQDQVSQSYKRPSGRKYTAASSQGEDAAFVRGRTQSLSSHMQSGNGGKEDKKKKFSLFKKKRKPASDHERRLARTPEVPGRRGADSYSGYGPESMPLARRPHSSSSHRFGGGGGAGGGAEDSFLRKGSQRSIKSSDFLDDEDEIDSSVNNGGGRVVAPPRPVLQTDYPRFMSTLSKKEGKEENHHRHNVPNGMGGYDSLEKYADIAARSGGGGAQTNDAFRNRSMSLRITADSKKEQNHHRNAIVPSRPAPPPPPPSSGQNPVSPQRIERVASLGDPGGGARGNGVSPSPLPPIPGLIGIKNHGNTCFMNAVLQCLGNTERFLHYLLSDDCQRDLATLKRRKKKRGPASSGVNAHISTAPSQDDIISPDSPGAVIDVLSYLIKSLWSGQYEGRVSAVFKEVVGLWAEQYRGRSQHDAQEFLLWLLGYLHDNLSLASRHQISKVCVFVIHT